MRREVLETRRLMLCELEPRDVDAILPMMQDPEVMRYWPHPYTRESTSDWIAHWVARYQEDGCGYWLVRNRHSGDVVGQAGVILQDLGGPEPEAGLAYIVHRPYWRQGYAYEAASACREWAFNALEVNRVIATVRPENVPSAAVARKLGMVPERDVDYKGYVHTVFVSVRTD